VKRLLTVAVLLTCCSAPSVALAAPSDDYRAVARDWQPDGVITPCRFSRTQLVNADRTAAALPGFDSYVPGFRTAVLREIEHRARGACKAKAKPKLSISAIRARGGLRESVTILNRGAAVRLHGYALRDRGGHRIGFPSGTRVRKGGRLRVFSGCAKGRRRALRRGSRLYACKRGTLWNDGGDVVRLLSRGRKLVARRGFGRFGSVKRVSGS
jgi:hypothetical protein